MNEWNQDQEVQQHAVKTVRRHHALLMQRTLMLCEVSLEVDRREKDTSVEICTPQECARDCVVERFLHSSGLSVQYVLGPTFTLLFN
jgi:hypothetical protein